MTTEKHIHALEQLELGTSWADAYQTAKAALDAGLAAARERLFPRLIVPVPEHAYAAYAHHVERFRTSRYCEDAADTHFRSLVSFPELAILFRTPEALDDVASAAHRVANVEPQASEAAAAARARYARTIAAQILDTPRHELRDAAQALLESEALATRLEAARRRHEDDEKARAQSARIDSDAKAVAQARQQQEAAEAAAKAEVERAASEARLARAEVLAERLQVQVASTPDVRLRVGSSLIPVREIIVAASALTDEQIDAYSTAWACGEFVADGGERRP